jgi:hypothetical protein
MALPKLTNTRKLGQGELLPVPAVSLGRGKFKILPPEIVLGTPNAGATCAEDGNEMFSAPMDNSKEALAIRAHEYAHLSCDRLLPELLDLFKATAIPKGWLQVGLDNVVNGFSRACNVHSIDHLPLGEKPTEHATRQQRAMRSLQIMSVKRIKKTVRYSRYRTKTRWMGVIYSSSTMPHASYRNRE